MTKYQGMKSFKSYLTEGAINATQFETDMVKAFNEQSSDGKDRAKQLKYQNPAAKRAAESCVRSLLQQAGGSPKIAYRTGAGGKGATLTPAYTSGGAGKSVKSGTPKTDVVFITNKKLRCSMKNGAAAQIASAQTNEIYAVLNAVFSGGAGAGLVKKISEIILQTGNEAVYKQTRDRYKKEYGEDGFDALLSRVTGLKSGAGTASKDDVNRMNEFLRLLGIKERISVEMSQFMNEQRNRTALLREFATGELRFTDEDFIPSHFLEWFEDGRVVLMTANQFISKTLPKFKFSLRDRGMKSSKGGTVKNPGSRGIAYRLDISNSKQEAYEWNSSELTEIAYQQYKQQLEEGIGDWLRAAGNVIRKGWETLKSALQGVVNFFARLLAQGFAGFMQFIGVEPVGMQYTW